MMMTSGDEHGPLMVAWPAVPPPSAHSDCVARRIAAVTLDEYVAWERGEEGWARSGRLKAEQRDPHLRAIDCGGGKRGKEREQQ